MAKLGQAWDEDPRIFAVQMGLIGHFGEHHHPAPTAEQRRLLAEAFKKAFKHKPVLVRHNDAEFMQAGFGIYYDTFANISREPPVGKQVFEQMITAAGVTVVYNERLDRTSGKGVTMDGKRITSITTLSGKTYLGKMFIDVTYVGDLMAAAGVTYTVGREPESQYGEKLAGVRRGDTQPRVHYHQGDKDHFVKEVDAYVKPGDPASGLLPHIYRIEGLKNGQGDKKIQAYNYRVCLTSDPANRIPLEKPAGYRATAFRKTWPASGVDSYPE